jgi:hypothetical protein
MIQTGSLKGKGIIMADEWGWGSKIGVVVSAIAAGFTIGSWAMLTYVRSQQPHLPPQGPEGAGPPPPSIEVSVAPYDLTHTPQDVDFLVTDKDRNVFVCSWAAASSDLPPSSTKEAWRCFVPVVWSIPEVLSTADSFEIESALIKAISPHGPPAGARPGEPLRSDQR